MGASQSARHICLFLSVVSTLVMSVSAAPEDALTMMPNTYTTCASATGAWTVGLNQGGLLTFVNTNGDEFSVSNRTFNGFTGGNCLEPSSGILYFISDYATGNLTRQNGAYGWTDDFFPGKNGNPIIQKDFTKATTTIGTAGHTVNCVAVTDKSITLWNPGAQAYTGVVDLAGISNGSAALKKTAIIGMAMSGDNLFIHYNADASNQRLALVNILSQGKQPTAPIVVGQGMKLVPVSGGGVALVNLTSPPGNAQVTYYDDSLTPRQANYPLSNGSIPDNLFILDQNNIHVVAKSGLVPPLTSEGGRQTDPPGQPLATPAPPNSDPNSKPAANHLPAIIGGVVGALALAAIVAFLIIRRRKTRRGGNNTTSRSLFSKKQQDLFPPKADDTLVPLGLYNQERGLLPPLHQDDDLARMGYMPHRGMRSADAPEQTAFLSHLHRSSTQPSIDESIPVEAALTHHRHDKHTPQGLSHSISVSSVTSRFPRHSAKSGKLFEEKIQLQVIRYEVPDAHLMAPHGTIGRLVLGTYHIISDPKSARSLKPQSKNNQGLARSGTVVVKKSRSSMLSGRNSPLVEMAEESSMLLTDAENQHTFEGATLKWYMTEIHWKREAALLKRLKSPIFVMELLESYCIPALQNRAFTYPFVNAMGGRTSLLSDLSPVKSAHHTRAILRSISAAVEWCHRHGVVHLNIQPGSFFLEDDIDPRTEDASWKLWDFTCARYIGERIGPFGGSGETATPTQYHPPANPSNPDSFPYMDQQQHDRQMDRIGGNPLPAAYTAPELLEAWRADNINFPVEANMDTWSLGCLYYEILTGQPLFPTETEAWGLVGGWEQTGLWSSKNFHVPYPPSPSAEGFAPATNESETTSPYERSQTLDPSGSIAKLLRDMMTINPEERVSLDTIMERVY
ncbi:hypothetical protein EC957_003362 [Mortierella hygrophila]|uniref:Protein kinase domain-containing protein n=1 Tax=Mortierella hygrophila TaxID=979708 RepID=A0A9P6K0I7_9FUNG|nr:hypothetical protein EC957_003362 [Mortierella hygrophila]